MKATHSPSFAKMPRCYAALCRSFIPRPIHDRADYENTVEVADIFAGFEDQMNADQQDYFDLLCDLIARYEEETLKPPKLKPIDLLKHLATEQNLSGADLSRILGKSLPLGPMILRGERKITASHAVCLGKHFGLRPDLFLG